MDKPKLNKNEKQAELTKYRNLVLLTLDYLIDNVDLHINTDDFDSKKHYLELKEITASHFQNGRLSLLKNWFRDLTEMQVETKNLNFNKYLQDNSIYKVDIFESFFQEIEKIVEVGIIKTDKQFYNVSIMVDHLCNTIPRDEHKIEILNQLLIKYENRK